MLAYNNDTSRWLLRLCIIAVICCFISAKLHAQISRQLFDKLPEDIKPETPQKADGKYKRFIIAYAGIYTSLRDTETVKELDAIALSLERESPRMSKREQAVNYTAIAEYYRKFRYNESPKGEWIPYCEKVIALSKDDSAMAITTGTAYMQIGDFLTSTGKYRQAQQQYFYALDYFKKSKDTAAPRAVYALISDNYSYMGQHHEALRYLELAETCFSMEEIQDGTRDKLRMENYYHRTIEYVELFSKEHNTAYLDTARKLIQQLKVADVSDTAKRAEYYYACMWTYFYKTGDYNNALKYIDSSLLYEDHFSSLHDQTVLCRGICLLKLGRTAEGRKLLLDNPSVGNDLMLGKMAYRELYLDAKSRGDAAAALKYFELTKKYEDSAAVLEQQSQVYEITQKYNVREKQGEINTLALRNAAQQKQRNFIIVVSIALAVLLLFIIVLLYALAKKRQVAAIHAQQELDGEKNKMERFLQDQDDQVRVAREHATLEQRKKISRDLHDGLSSTLAALRYYINDMRLHRDNMKEQKMLEDIEMEVASIYAQTRDYMHNLYKGSELANVDLHEFLEGLSGQFSNQQGFHIRLQADMEEIERLDSEQQTQVYYVIKESITNAIKHAGASVISINISFDEGQCMFSIADNGVGISSDAKEGIGVKSMAQRIEGLGGKLYINSDRSGTRIDGKFPVVAHAGLV